MCPTPFVVGFIVTSSIVPGTDSADRMAGYSAPSPTRCATPTDWTDSDCVDWQLLPRVTPFPEMFFPLAAFGGAAVQAVIIHRPDPRQFFAETPVPSVVWNEIYGQTLTEGLQWVALGVDTPPNLAASLVVRTSHNGTANSLHEAVHRGLEVVSRMPDLPWGRISRDQEIPAAHPLPDSL